MSEPIGANIYVTHCFHGLDLRVHPRCYLCKPVAIEAEAIAQERERLRVAVERLPRQMQYADPFFPETYDYETVALSVVLALLSPDTGAATGGGS